MAKGAVRLDRVHATRGGNILSVKSAADELQNGYVVFAHALSSGEREVFDAIKPATATITTDEVLLIASPEITYNAGETISDFTNAAGKVARAIPLKNDDIVTITDNVISGAAVVGKFLIPQNASYQLVVANDLSGGTRFAGEVIEKTTIYGLAATVIRVIKG
nr:hypothetical protein [Mycobacterium sp. E3298]